MDAFAARCLSALNQLFAGWCRAVLAQLIAERPHKDYPDLRHLDTRLSRDIGIEPDMMR